MEADSSFYFEIDAEVDPDFFQKLNSCAGGSATDVASCTAVHEGLKLTPYQAREERLWTYMAHVYLLEYARKRWPIPADDKDAVSHIRTHFFARTKRQYERDNVGSRLWWMAHLCARATEMPLHEALEVMLYQTDVRANIIERPTLSRSASVFSSILELLNESFKEKKKLFERSNFRKFMIGINDFGGFVLLDALEISSIKEILKNIIKTRLQLSEL
jgi:hypothetical protein